IGGSGVQQVHPQLAGETQQVANLGIVRQFKTRGIFDPFVATDLDGAEADAGDIDAGTSQLASWQGIVHARLPSQRGLATAGDWRWAASAMPSPFIGAMPWRSSSRQTLSPRSGDRVSLVGQATSRFPLACR